jgi:hypothetical protein
MLSSNTNVGQTTNHTLTTDLPNLPGALVLKCRLCKVDTTLYIATWADAVCGHGCTLYTQ